MMRRDERRFRKLFDQHYRAVARFVRARTSGPADADELIAETFKIAIGGLEKVPDGRDALPWLLSIARRNLSADAWRPGPRQAPAAEEQSRATTQVLQPTESQGDGAEVISALAVLDPDDRDLILLTSWDELTPSQAGAVVGLRPTAAQARLSRARQQLGALFDNPTVLSSARTPTQLTS